MEVHFLSRTELNVNSYSVEIRNLIRMTHTHNSIKF